MTSKETGNAGEKLTAMYLIRSGYKILCRNYTVRGGEIDIIAEKNGIIVFAVVKTRDISAFESGITAVTKRKKRLIIRASQEYLYRTGTTDLQPRFDAAEVITRNGVPVKLRYFPDAFSADDSDTII